MKSKERKFVDRMKLSGEFIKNYNIVYLVIVGLIILFEFGMACRGFMIFDFNKNTHLGYLISYNLLAYISIAVFVILIKVRKNKISTLAISIVMYVYASILLIWGGTISAIDMIRGEYPIVFLTMVVTTGAIAMMHPYIYSGIIIVATTILVFISSSTPVKLYDSGTLINIVIFIIMSIMVSYRAYVITLKELIQQKKLRTKATIDQPTQLYNESYFFETIGEIDKKYKEYAIAVMDVNELKLTNDTYGHRFGNSLVVTTGKTLSKIFRYSDVFHIGGDEFVAILHGKDYENREALLKLFSEQLEYTEVEFEGQKLILSVAIGLAEKGNDIVKDVLQKADKKMYENKKKVKKQYNLKGTRE